MTGERDSLMWVKSTLSYANHNCVEVTDLPDGTVGMRNSRDPDGPVLSFTPDEWVAFLGGAKDGEFDRFGAAGREDAVAFEFIPVRRLYVSCSLPASGDSTCQLPADSAVVMEDGGYRWRCGLHRGQRRPGEMGPVVTEIPADALRPSDG